MKYRFSWTNWFRDLRDIRSEWSMHRKQSDKRIGAIWRRGNTPCSKTPLSDVFSGAYQRRHNSEVQLIIRRQIHSGISSVSDGSYEIRAAVKAKWPHTNTHTYKRAALVYVYVYSLEHITSGRRKQNAMRGYEEVPKFEKWDSHRKYVISKSRRAEILFLRGISRYVKIYISEMERWFHSELFQKFVILKFVFSLFFRVNLWIFGLLRFDFERSRDAVPSNIKLFVSDIKEFPFYFQFI